MGLLFTEQWDKFHEPSFAKRRQDHVGLPRAPPGRGRMTTGSRSIPSPLGCRAMLRAAALAAVLPLTACSSAGVLDPQGPIAAAERLLLVNSTAIMLVVVVPVVLATLGFAWWYRASNPRARRSLELAYEGRIEFVTWSIPALDWKWLFIYPDQGVAAVNRLVVPTGTPLQFRLTSATVMNSFFVPQLGSQIYAMSGMTTHLNLLADRPGEYPGISANFSGDGFPDMRFTAKAVSASDFANSVREVRSAGVALDEASYIALAKPSRAVAPATYGSVEAGLFDRILKQTTSGSDAAVADSAWCSPTLP